MSFMCPALEDYHEPLRDHPVKLLAPRDLNHSALSEALAVQKARVSTLLMLVGFPQDRILGMIGGLLLGSARMPEMTSSKAVSSPKMYPPGMTNMAISKERS